MALAFAISRYYPMEKGGVRRRIVAITADTDYPTGGWAITPANVKLNAITHIAAEPVGGYVFEYNDATAKLMAYWGDNNNAADGPLIEIPAGDNGVDTKVIKCYVVGY